MRLMMIAMVLALFTGCAATYNSPVIPAFAAVNSIKAPLDIDYDQTNKGTKVGKASVVSVLGLMSTGDASSQAAAENGGLKVIYGADYEFFSVLGLYNKYTTVVYGE